jgi:hypothetical protein
VRAYAALTKSDQGRAQVDVFAGDLKPPDCVDAIAWRDFVPAEQRLGSRVFTELELARAVRAHRYAHATYVTSTRDDDGRSDVQAALVSARRRNCAVDAFFLENAGGVGPNRMTLPDIDIDVEWLPYFRLAYDTGGGGTRAIRSWRSRLTAENVVTHGTESSWSNVAPIFYVFFLARLADGVTVDDAVNSANERTHTVLTILGLDEMWRDTKASVSTSTRPTSPSRSTF